MMTPKNINDSWLTLGVTVGARRPRMAPKLWRLGYGAKGMHAFIDYHRSSMLPSNVERLWHSYWRCTSVQAIPQTQDTGQSNLLSFTLSGTPNFTPLGSSWFHPSIIYTLLNLSVLGLCLWINNTYMHLVRFPASDRLFCLGLILLSEYMYFTLRLSNAFDLPLYTFHCGINWKGVMYHLLWQ